MVVEQRVLFNLTNLRGGGGVQAAASFIDELARGLLADGYLERFPWLAGGTAVWASSAVLENVTSDLSPLDVTERNGRIHLGGARTRWDVVFTLFGPDYRPPPCATRIVGFADGTSLHPELAAIPKGFRGRLRRHLSRLRFRSADWIVVEADHVGAALADRWGIEEARIRVIPNALHGVFDAPETWLPISIPAPSRSFERTVCYVSRGYPHKNLDVLGRVGETLETVHGIRVRFLLTLSDAEWHRLSPLTQQRSVSVGPIAINQVPSIYAAADASVFPSLLESFSISPLEALRTGTPLVASNRAFVRDIVGDGAMYVDPTNAQEIARALATVLQDQSIAEDLRERGMKVVAGWPTARDRCRSYLELVDEVLP